LHIQRLIADKKLGLVYSYLSVYENSENPNPEHRNSILKFFHYATECIDIDKADVIETRAEVIRKWKIKSNDSIHLACAIEAKLSCSRY
jgi:predicted nucleic acid-binding protein